MVSLYPTQRKCRLKRSTNGTTSPPKFALTHQRQVKTGQSYKVRVTADGYATVERDIFATGPLVVTLVSLIPNDWPYYLMGGIEIPFKPRPRLAGLALGKPVASPTDLAKLIVSAEKAGFMRVTKDPDGGGELDDVNGSVLYFEPKSPDMYVLLLRERQDYLY